MSIDARGLNIITIYSLKVCEAIVEACDEFEVDPEVITRYATSHNTHPLDVVGFVREVMESTNEN